MHTALPASRMYRPDALIECACDTRRIIHGAEAIADYWRHRFAEMPALDLEDLQLDGGAVVISYRTSSGTVQASLNVGRDGLIARCRCGPIESNVTPIKVPARQDMLMQLEKLRRDAAECELIRDLAVDTKKRELFDQIAAHLSVLATQVERAILESGKEG
jgi:hypothetical protein